MRLTTFTDYSLRLLIYLASAPGKKATIAQVARTYGISEHHMVKVVHLLGKAGFLKNTRGRGGGVELARPASEINVGRVVRLTEGEDVPAECFDEATNTCRIAGSCRLQWVLRKAAESFHRVLEEYTLEHLVANQAQLQAVLHPAIGRRLRRVPSTSHR
jgi:Rrf2 family nitric oxide-sensitive transcriptional repressor